MGINALGSNKKPRTSLIFETPAERNIFKNAVSDLASEMGMSPSRSALEASLEAIATTPQTRNIARSIYASNNPSLLDGLELIFQELAAEGEKGRDAFPMVAFFLKISLDLGLRINTTSDDTAHFKNQWKSIEDILNFNSGVASLEAELAARNANQLGTVLDCPCPMQEAASFVASICESWNLLRNYSCTFRALCALSRMAFPARKGVAETAENRLTFFREADIFYRAGIEVAEI